VIVDLLDTISTMATGVPVSGGINGREATNIVLLLCADINRVGFERVESYPALGRVCRRSLNSVPIFTECLTGLAMTEEGKTGKHQLDLLPSDHAMDVWHGDQQQQLAASKAEEERGPEERAPKAGNRTSICSMFPPQGSAATDVLPAIRRRLL